MMIRRLFRFAPALLVVAAGTFLMAGCRHPHCGFGKTPEEKADKVAGRLAKELDLDESQKSRLDAIKNDILSRKDDFKALKDGFHAEALAQIRAGSVDVDRLNADLSGREAKAQELRAFLVGKFAEFHAVLEPAQREKLAARLEKHHKDCR